jgi:hypothetical protein
MGFDPHDPDIDEHERMEAVPPAPAIDLPECERKIVEGRQVQRDMPAEDVIIDAEQGIIQVGEAQTQTSKRDELKARRKAKREARSTK